MCSDYIDIHILNLLMIERDVLRWGLSAAVSSIFNDSINEASLDYKKQQIELNRSKEKKIFQKYIFNCNCVYSKTFIR